jgi:FHA domain-containing protein
MRECQQCGELNQASARFCVVCGIPLPGPAVSVEAAGPVLAAAAAVPLVSLPGGTGRPGAPASLEASAARELGHDFPLDGPRTLVGFLVSYDSVELGQYWPIHQGRSVLGRLGAATGLDIEIAHPTTSSLHAVLLARAQPGRILVEDTTSTNGTFVNDNPLAPGRRWELRDGDRVRFGLFNTIVKVIQS